MSPSLPAAEPVEGGVIDRKYRLESLLGEGGMGSVWRAFNLQLEVPVAIKLLRADLHQAELRERLRVEARAAAKLVHPSIVRVFDIGEAESGEPFIVMELLNGESLSTTLERGPLAPEQAISLLLPIAEALALAHSRGVVHRDLKPDNVFIAREGSVVQPKLLDFGIAKVTSALIAGGPTLTQSGTLLGSPDYMSPEQAYGRSDIDERSDVWAFCVLLYESMAGFAPFAGDTTQAILRRVVSEEPPPLDSVSGVPSELASIVHRGMAKDRDARPASIFELGHALALWLYRRGVLEDITGASLEAKWLGRPAESLTPGAASISPRAQHEQQTLVSVVHPSPRLSSQPVVVPLQRRPHRLALGLAAAAALTIGAGWASTLKRRALPMAALPAEGEGAVAAAAAAPTPDPAAAALTPEPAAPPVLALTALPIEPASAKAKPAPTFASAVSRAPSPKPDVPNAVPVSAPSLPEALPPQRVKRGDLMNPY
jgi:eukaryotic-like serine/threonine-protein kinase